MTLQTDNLERILALARAEVKCPTCAGEPYFSSHWPCPPCHGTGKVPDPRYKDLVKALTEECSVHYTMVGNRYTPHVSQAECHGCGGSNRVPRTEWRQQGELAGVLKHQAEILWEPYPHSEVWGNAASEITNCFGKADCNAQATRIVLEALKEDIQC